jgi:two-component system nitrogen regulation sensor histidine kinase GlnL
MKKEQIEKLNRYSSFFALKMMEALPDAVLVFEKDLQIVFANEAAEILFKREKSLADLKVSDLAGGASAVLESIHLSIKDGKPVTLYDVTLNDKSADRVTIRPLEESGLYMMVIHLHSMELKSEWSSKARHALRPAQMMARTLAHEIKNPLAGIQAAAQLLARLDLKADDKELANLIVRESDRILRLVKKVDVFGETANADFKAVNIHEVLGHATQAARTAFGPGIEIKEEYDPSLPDLQGDFDQLMQVEMNLIKNAAEALPNKKGKISIRTFYDNRAGYHPESREKLPLCIEIEDNGEGIDADTLRRIFEPFFTTKPQGEGLGLSIVSKIVDDHGGLIDVNSAPGKTVFRLSFPLKPMAKEGAQLEKENARRQGRKKDKALAPDMAMGGKEQFA